MVAGLHFYFLLSIVTDKNCQTKLTMVLVSVRCVIFKLAHNGPRLCVRAGFLALTLIRSRKLKFSTIFHTKHVTPPDAKPLLQAVFFICQLRLSLSQSFLLLVSLRCCRKRNLRKLSKFYLLARLYQLQLVCLFLQVS